VLYCLKRYDDAIARCDAGLGLVDAYLSKEPNDAPARRVAMRLHGNRAVSLKDLGRHRESAEDWARVVELSPDPVPPGFRIQWAVELLKSNEPSRAAAQIQLVKQDKVVRDADCYSFCVYFAICGAAARNDARAAPAQRAILVETHVKDALRWLKSTAETGVFNDATQREAALKDPDLKILRDRPQFRQLIDSSTPKP
jgi:hypothetical protein